ncbi:uncharacterized protein [Eucyclogobius newberryi]|uniref:uncharacterized protein n=1 Tax=Eucyclogobius newberryi TaxID=166745 RepID=UPI003B5921DB
MTLLCVFSGLSNVKMKWAIRIFMIDLLVSGVCSGVSIEQPLVITASLGQDVTFPCLLKVSGDDTLTIPPVLYWLFKKEDQEKMLHPSREYEHRVARLDQQQKALNLSIRFKDVQWEDRGEYLCKVSVTTQQRGSFREKGRATELLLYDEILFQTSGLNSSVLQCGVHVSPHPGFELSSSSGGQTLNSTSVLDTTSSLHVTLFQSIAFGSRQKYQCSLYFNGELISSSTFLNPLSGDGGLVDETGTFSGNVSVSEEKYPEPWFLYSGLILVQVVLLSALTIVMLSQICCRLWITYNGTQ